MSGSGADVSRAVLPELRSLDVGGEALGQDVLEAWAPGRQLFNTYGPTEAAVVTAGCEVKVGDVITIGWDFPSYKHLVLDAETLTEMAAGERGMLYIFGVGVGRGYLNDASKTNDRFRSVPGHGRGYCTGDLAFLDPQDGRIHFCGRADWQVKMRGLRIELETLEEAVLSANEAGVQFCEARPFDSNTKLALIASGPNVNEAVIRSSAAKLGAGYVLHCVKVIDTSEWKFNSSNKLVRNYVPLVDQEQESAEENKPQDWRDNFESSNASDLEMEIASCVAELVVPSSAVQKWNCETHFIEELGIDSAGFGKLLTQLRRQSLRFPEMALVDLPLLFQQPTVKSLARRLAEKASEEAEEAAMAGDEELTLPSLEAARTCSRRDNVCNSATTTSILDLFLSKLRHDPYSPVAEVGCQSICLAQVFQFAIAIQRVLRKGFRANMESRRRESQSLDPTGAQGSLESSPSERVVVLMLPAGLESLSCLIAALVERATICFLNPSLPVAEFESRIKLLAPAAIITCSTYAGSTFFALDPALVKPAAVIDLASLEVPTASLPQTIRRPQAPTDLHGRNQQAAAFLMISSGSVSDGKLTVVPLSEDSVLEEVSKWQQYLDLKPESRIANLQGMVECPRVGAIATGIAVITSQAGGRLVVPQGGILPVLTSLAIEDTELRAKAQASQAERLLKRWVEVSRPTALCCFSFHLEALTRATYHTGSDGFPELKLVCHVDSTKPCPEALAMQWSSSNKRLLSFKAGATDSKLRCLACFELGKQVALPELTGSAPSRLGTAGSLPRLLGSSPTAGQNSAFKGNVALEGSPDVEHGTDDEDAEEENVGAKVTVSASLVRGAQRFRRRSMTTISSLTRYIIDLGAPEDTQNHYAEGAVPKFCFVVQTLILCFNLVYTASKMVFQLRWVLPLLSDNEKSPLLILAIMAALVIGEAVLPVLSLLIGKWLLIGRYKEGVYPIYGTYYLRHWVVEYLSSGTAIGSEASYDYRPARALIKNLQLRLLGADVALSSMITGQVTGWDCVKIGPLTTVQSHLTAINYRGQQMTIGRQDIGAGATVGCHSVIESGSKVMPGAIIETLSCIPSGATISGRWSGTPARHVGAADRTQEPNRSDANWHVVKSMLWLPAEALAWLLEKAITTLLSVVVIFLFISNVTDDFAERSHLIANLPFLPLAFGMASAKVVEVVFWHIMAILSCRILPQIKPPYATKIHSLMGQIMSLKLRLSAFSSNSLGDSELQTPFFRLCGAKIGKGSIMAEQTMLPETVSIGENNFFASANVITSFTVHQGLMNIPCRTVIGDNVFMGNNNYVSEGVHSNSFLGHKTWLPQKPHKAGSFFGNPAMCFERPSAPAPACEDTWGCCTHCIWKLWYHLRTSIIDPFMWDALKTQVLVGSFVLGQRLWPSYTEPWQPLAEIMLFAGIEFASWFIMSVVFCNWLHSGRVPMKNDEDSSVALGWNTKFKIRVGVFKPPFNIAGTEWVGPVIRLSGGNVGKRFFSPINDDEMFGVYDSCFVDIGDDVTLDYEAVIQNHSFEDHQLKFIRTRVGSGTTLMQNSNLACSDVGQRVTLGSGSVTWKGQILEDDRIYNGSPATEIDEGMSVNVNELPV
eukprot:TRINITY_DN8187_c2_g1_i1.p1 TRINITY_DN8187_c2_g1~~TRINITY_DN8187_c2_g1_i1.p1  ORF type:complete len:1871 (+),score=316.61 TRINITY_DN8187_c2_g1_i1:800-5614(+)